MKKELITIADFRELAKKKLPRVAFDFVDGGAETEYTVRENERIFQDVAIRPRQAVEIDAPNLATTVFGQQVAFPVLLAPVGMARILNPIGDLAAVRAAGAAGTGFALTTMSGHSIEEIAAARSGPLFYQVYQVGSRDRVEAAIDRARATGYDGLIVTLDTMRNGNRLRDRRNGVYTMLTASKFRAARYLPQLIRHPFWLARRMVDGLVPDLKNVILDDGKPQKLGQPPRSHSLRWEDVAWLKEIWNGPVIVKGILTADDAHRALDLGADGIVVSNHGGRQLDYSEATLRVLPEIIRAVHGRCDVVLDGGIRRGTDVMKALALGARAVLVGRAWAWGLAARGQVGIEQVLGILREELSHTLGSIGCADVRDLDETFVRAPTEWLGKD